MTTRTLEVGDEIPYWSPFEFEIDGRRVGPGDIGVVIEVRPAVPATGITIGYTEDGDPLIDHGIEAYVVVRFPSGAVRAKSIG
jgi:hypothetical protein